MKRPQIFVLMALLGLPLGACASKHIDDRYVLGTAITTNIAQHSIRDPNVPNSKALAGDATGQRAVLAIERLNTGTVIQPDGASTTEGLDGGS